VLHEITLTCSVALSSVEQTGLPASAASSLQQTDCAIPIPQGKRGSGGGGGIAKLPADPL